MPERQTNDELDVFIEHISANYENEFASDLALAHLAAVEDRLVVRERLRTLARTNSFEDFRELKELDEELLNGLISLVDRQKDIAIRGINDAKIRLGLNNMLLTECNLYHTLKLPR